MPTKVDALKIAILPSMIGLLLVVGHPRPSLAPPSTPMAPLEVKAAFLKQLDRPRVALDPVIRQIKGENRGVIAETLDFGTDTRADGSIERVPALLARPNGVKGRMPAVIVLHGTGGRKEAMWNWLEQLAHRGIVAIAIDGRYHGERTSGSKGTKDYNDAIINAWRAKADGPASHPLYYDTCWDIWRTIDYLETRGDVDASRIGMIGISKGGIETWLAAAVDDRVKVAVPAISVQSFKWSLEHERYQARANTVKEAHEAAALDLNHPKVDAEVCRAVWAKVLPGITDEFDAPSMLPLFAGRSLMILNGEKDPNCPIEGAELAFTAAKAAFHDADADDHLKIMVAKDSGHILTPEQHQAALHWFVTWLKPTIPDRAARFMHAKALAAADTAFVGPRLLDRPVHPRPSKRPIARRRAPTSPLAASLVGASSCQGP